MSMGWEGFRMGLLGDNNKINMVREINGNVDNLQVVSHA